MAFTLAAAVITMAAAATSAYASYQAGVQQRNAADFNARMAEYNAEQARQAAQAKAEIYQKEVDRRMGAIRQQFAASGVELGPGTPLTVMMDSAQAAAKDIVRIKAGGEATAWSFLSEASLQRSVGESAMAQGQIGAGASLLGGASRAMSIYSASTKRPVVSPMNE